MKTERQIETGKKGAQSQKLNIAIRPATWSDKAANARGATEATMPCIAFREKAPKSPGAGPQMIKQEGATTAPAKKGPNRAFNRTARARIERRNPFPPRSRARPC